jgi:hypothetical protein
MRGNEASARDAGLRHRWLAAVALTCASLAPVAGVIVQRAGKAYIPVQDQAILDLRIRDVFRFSVNTPLVGAYSRFGWNHPGPALYYLVAPFTFIFGNPAWASVVGCALIEGAAISWIAHLAWKVGGLRWCAVWLAVVVLSYVGTGPSLVESIWNPNVAYPFLILFLLECVLVALGEVRHLLGLVFVGTFLVQTHIGYVAIVTLLSAWALLRMLVGRRRSRRAPAPSTYVLPVLVLAAMWFPPLVLDPLLHSPSNISRIVDFYTGSQHQAAVLGVRRGLGYLATEFRLVPPWLGRSDPTGYLSGLPVPASALWLLIPVALLVAAWLAAYRQRRYDLTPVVEACALLFLASGVSLVLLRGNPEPYLYYWRIIAGATTVLVSLTVIIECLGARARGKLKSIWTVLVVMAVVVGSIDLTSQVERAGGPLSPYEAVATTLLNQLHEADQPAGSTIVRYSGSIQGGVQAGVFDQLAREGKPVYVDRTLGYQFGYGRTALPQQVKWVWYVTEDSEAFSILSSLPGARVLAETHPLDVARQSQLVSLQRELAHELNSNGLIADDDDLGNPLVAFQLAHLPFLAPKLLNQLAALNTEVTKRVCLCGVIELPAGPTLPGQALEPG